MPKIEMQDLIQSYSQMTPESINLIKWFYANFDNRSAANRQIINVEPLYFQGASAGTEFLTYAATKLYIALLIEANGQALGSIAGSSFSLYNEANAINSIYSNINAYWNGTTNAVNYNHQFVTVKNSYFSRVALITLNYIKFNGFRITLV